MTIPQILMAIWLSAGVTFDLLLNRNGNHPKGWWVGRIIGHAINMGFIVVVLHYGGFW